MAEVVLVLGIFRVLPQIGLSISILTETSGTDIADTVCLFCCLILNGTDSARPRALLSGIVGCWVGVR
jgi:hypothetical protein